MERPDDFVLDWRITIGVRIGRGYMSPSHADPAIMIGLDGEASFFSPDEARQAARALEQLADTVDAIGVRI